MSNKRYNYDELKIKFGEKIKNLREKVECLNQDNFAENLNKKLSKYGEDSRYDGKTISNWENGKSLPKLDVLIKICIEFDISLDELLKDEIEKTKQKRVASQNSGPNILQELIDEQKKEDIEGFNWNHLDYTYGKISYVVDNLVKYRSSYSRYFKIDKEEKYASIILGVLDIKDGKRDFYKIGTGENDINFILKSPKEISYSKTEDHYNEIINNDVVYGIPLGKNRSVFLNPINIDNKSLNEEDFKILEDEVPEDFYEIFGNDCKIIDYTWLDYYLCKVLEYTPCEKVFDTSTLGYEYYKNEEVIVFFCDGKVKLTDKQIEKVLVDDYKWRVHNELENISNDDIYNDFLLQIEKYKKGIKY